MAQVPSPTEKRKHRLIFLSLLACNPRMIGIGMRKIHISVIKLVMLVLYVNATLSTQVAVRATVAFHQP